MQKSIFYSHTCKLYTTESANHHAPNMHTHVYMHVHVHVPVLKAGPQLMMSGWGGGAKGIPLLPVDLVPPSLALSSSAAGKGGCGR